MRGRIPEECLCQWAAVARKHNGVLDSTSGEDHTASTPHPFFLANRDDLDNLVVDYNQTYCAKFEKAAEMASFPRTPLQNLSAVVDVESQDAVVENGVNRLTSFLPSPSNSVYRPSSTNSPHTYHDGIRSIDAVPGVKS